MFRIVIITMMIISVVVRVADVGGTERGRDRRLQGEWSCGTHDDDDTRTEVIPQTKHQTAASNNNRQCAISKQKHKH